MGVGGPGELADRPRNIVAFVNTQLAAAHLNKRTQYFRLIVVRQHGDAPDEILKTIFIFFHLPSVAQVDDREEQEDNQTTIQKESTVYFVALLSQITYVAHYLFCDI